MLIAVWLCTKVRYMLVDKDFVKTVMIKVVASVIVRINKIDVWLMWVVWY